MATAPRVGVDSQALVAGAQGWLVCNISELLVKYCCISFIVSIIIIATIITVKV